MAKTEKTDKSLVIVESPAKAKTINKYLGSSYIVKASMGHICDLPKKKLNVDIENNFTPIYEITPGRKKLVNELKKDMKSSKTLYLATDLDREGEAIAWHISETLAAPQDKTYRVIFNAITKNDIQNAFANPGKIDIDKVNAQQARRILDRIVGYEISPLLWKKVAGGLSAGRVQSVAVKMVVEKERQIRAFEPQEYWLIPAIFTAKLDADLTEQWKAFIGDDPDKSPTIAQQYEWLAANKAFKADLIEVDGKKFDAKNKQDADKIFNAITNAKYSISKVESKLSKSTPAPPFITSTLQQAAANRLGFSTFRTMSVAQQLYEGIEIGSRGSVGLITYMRTDSTHLSKESLEMARSYIRSQFGDKYLPEKPNFYSASKNAQAAHEAIRPTDANLSPNEINQYLSQDQAKLYDLIWRRFLACQMSPAQWNVTTVEVIADTKIGNCLYRANGRVQVFDGFTKIWQTPTTDQYLPQLKTGEQVKPIDITASQHFTKPPARYTEASLVKALEKEGIGRPSTYSSIISTIQNRKYVEQREKKFYATDIGEVVTDKLNDFFPQIMDIAFTREMESQLDKIEEQHLDWVTVLKEFYGPFSENLKIASKEMTHAKAEETPSEYNCPKCGSVLNYRLGKNGKFLSCSKYPDCKFASPCDSDGKMVKDEFVDHKCPTCGKQMVKKVGRFGPFISCSDYPNCKTILKIDKEGNIKEPSPPPIPTGITCHKCKKGELVLRASKKGDFLGCNRFPRCRTIVSGKMTETLQQLQKDGKWPPDSEQEVDEILGRKKAAKQAKTAKKKEK